MTTARLPTSMPPLPARAERGHGWGPPRDVPSTFGPPGGPTHAKLVRQAD